MESIGAIAQLKLNAAACTAVPEGWTGTSVEGCPLLCPSTLSEGTLWPSQQQ